MLNIIFKFLKRLFKFSTDTAAENSLQNNNAPKANQGISYSKQLIPTRQHEHQELVHLYGQIGDALYVKNYLTIDKILEKLKVEFSKHIMQENVSFYCYIEQELSNDPHRMELIRNYRKEMNSISHAFVKFIKKWQNTLITEETVAEFHSEYDAIGAVLAQRINSEEEHLYPLYQPSAV